MDKCNICKVGEILNKETYSNDSSTYDIKDCSKCGEFIIEHTLYKELEPYDIPHTISSYIREENLYNKPPFIYSKDKINELLKVSEKIFDTKYKTFLRQVNKDLNFLSGKSLAISFKNVQEKYTSLCWCKDTEEFKELILEAFKRGHIDGNKDLSELSKITNDGEEFLEAINYFNNANTIFISYNIKTDYMENFEQIVEKSVSNCAEGKLKTFNNYNHKIDDKIIDIIKSSKAIIADFTDNSSEVSYISAYAEGLNIPVIWTCKNEQKYLNKLNFDLRLYPFILWDNEKDLYEKLSEKIKEKVL